MRIIDALDRSDLVVVTRAWRGGDALAVHPDDFHITASAADFTPTEPLDQESP